MIYPLLKKAPAPCKDDSLSCIFKKKVLSFWKVKFINKQKDLNTHAEREVYLETADVKQTLLSMGWQGICREMNLLSQYIYYYLAP